METYLVGGAVRDELLGRPVRERDWVVVGAREADLVAAGFKPVGKDFPVFLHPGTGEEYALARTERRVGRGHRGFECETENVTLEEDLTRRDLTINAIARDEAGSLVDPTGGVQDLENRILRHVSTAFREDPLRVLRVARFAAAFAALGFRIHEDTLALMRQMVSDGEIADLTAERVQMELSKALATPSPGVFFRVLDDVGAGTTLWPTLNRSGIERLERIAAVTDDELFRLAALLSETPLDEALAIVDRYRLGRRSHDFVRLSRHLGQSWSALSTLAPAEVVDVLYDTDAFRQPERFLELNDYHRLLAACEGEANADETANLWERMHAELAAIGSEQVDPTLTGKAVGDAIRAAREERAAQMLRD